MSRTQKQNEFVKTIKAVKGETYSDCVVILAMYISFAASLPNRTDSTRCAQTNAYLNGVLATHFSFDVHELRKDAYQLARITLGL